MSFARLTQTIHQAQLIRTLGGDGVAGQDCFHRCVAPDDARQAKESAGAGDEVALDLSQPERRASTGHDHVSSKHDLTSTSSGQAIHSHNHGLFAFAIHEASEATSTRVEICGFTRVDCLQIGSGTKHWSLLAGGIGLQDRNPHIVVGFELVNGCFKPSCDVAVHCVAGIWAIQGDDGNFAGDFVSNYLRI